MRQEMAKQGDLESCKLFLSVISTLSDVMEDLELENIYYFLFYVNICEAELDENNGVCVGAAGNSTVSGAGAVSNNERQRYWSLLCCPNTDNYIRTFAPILPCALDSGPRCVIMGLDLTRLKYV